MAESFLLNRSLFTGGDSVLFMRRAQWGESFSLEPQRTYYYLCLAFLALVIFFALRIRKSGVGRSMIAVRDNESAAAAFSISPTRVKLTAFGVGGAIAGLAGGLFAGLLVSFQVDAFRVEESLRIVSIAVIGGLASVTGAVLGALWVIGLPALFSDSQEVALLTSGIGLLILLLYFPGGLVQILYSIRDGVYGLIARRMGDDAAPTTERAETVGALVTSEREPPPEGVAALDLEDVSVSFGARRVVDGVSLEVGRDEIVGLIGANGAGKTTLMNAVGGYVPSSGDVSLYGTRLTGRSASSRARVGLGRAFQNADLFGDLTVRETVQTALEARATTRLVPTLLGTPGARRAERAKRSEADELIAFFGLGRYADRFVDELSTGTRRIVELACLVGVDARVLCLDEPTAGVAQRETEAFGPLIVRLREELGASLLVIEHDMPLIMSISDRVYCLEAGKVIAEGDPETVRNDPLVVASYLGTDERAIDRSDS